ncbi:MAG: hypothetical protein JO117_10575 [Verrucomicrobia bacterium]|nr:hypothetical protein [Verrucomicrobiota bacterium]MBV9659480.1 hypothetical protein [Verrucomicrobiota bacterium]
MPPPPPPSYPPQPPGYYPPQPAPRRGWWSRNWLWFVPTGCVGLLLLLVAFVLMIVSVVFGAIKSSDAYKTALARAQADPRVIEALGTPILAGWAVTGSVNVNPAGGNADLNIPISGPKGAGAIDAHATKDNGAWNYSKLTVQIKNTGDVIDLRARERRDLRVR